MFIGRKHELENLERLYNSNNFEFAVFYGRRRVGKTTLINEFLNDKKAVYYMAVEGTEKDNLIGLSKAILEYRLGSRQETAFTDYEALLDYVDSVCMEDRLILAIDEYPYLAASCPAISSMIQKHIDQRWKDSRLFLILCGSSMSFMEHQVLGYKSPLYGRRTAQFKVSPFNFFESRQMLMNYQPEEQAILYGVTGGIPEYLSRINTNINLDDNIKRMFFDESGRLFEEPSNLLKQELRDPASYHSIISAVATGASRMNEIATKTGMESSACSNQMASLISLGIIKKETPVTEQERSRKTLYRLQDTMFLFWYRFVRPNVSGINRGAGSAIYDNIVKAQLSDFMGSIFEEICKQYLFLPEIYSSLPFPLVDLGRWWGSHPRKKRREEIDLMSVFEKKALFGECKWRNSSVGEEVLDTLAERGEMFQYYEKYFYVFSKMGFTEAAKKYAEQGTFKLITFEDMLRQSSASQV